MSKLEASIPAEAGIQNNDLPKGWDLVPLGKLRGGKAKGINPSELPDEVFELYSVPSFSEGTPEIISGEEIGSSKRIVVPNTVLLSKINPRINRVWIVGPEIKHRQISSPEWIEFFPTEAVEPKYLLYFMQNQRFREHLCMNVSGVGGSLTRIRPKVAEDYEIPLAPKEQQKRIVAKIEELFSHIDTGIEALKKAKQLLKQYRQSVLKAAVTGELTKDWREANKDKLEPASQLLERILKERRQKWEEQQLEQFRAKGKIPKNDKWKDKHKELGVIQESAGQEVPREWLLLSLDQVADVISGFAFKSKDFINSGIAVIKIANVSYGEFVWKQQQFLPSDYLEKHNDFVVSPKDVLLALTRPITNNNVKACLYPDDAEPALLNQRVCTIKNGKYLLKDYLLQVLQSEPFKQQIKSGMSETLQPNLSPKDLKNFCFGLPPIEEQKEVIRQVEEKLGMANRLLGELQKQYAKAEKNKQSILASAFFGKLNH